VIRATKQPQNSIGLPSLFSEGAVADADMEFISLEAKVEWGPWPLER
jgi:hypothetical protein